MAMAPTEQIPSYNGTPPGKPRLDTVSLLALMTAVPGLGLVSIPLGIWGVIRTKNYQRRGRTLAVISFVLIGLWAIAGTVVGVMAGLSVTSSTEQAAAPPPSGLVAPTSVPATVSPAPATVSPTPVAPSKKKILGDQPHGPLRKAKKVYWDQLKTGDCVKGMSEKYTYRVTRVDCRSRHQAEVTGRFILRGGSRYPGDKAVEKASDARCEKYFAHYVGIDWDSSVYDYDYVTPEPFSGGRVTARSSAWPSTRTIPRTTGSPCARSRSNAAAARAGDVGRRACRIAQSRHAPTEPPRVYGHVRGSVR